MKKKIIALLLSLVMLVGIIPAAVYAADGDAKVTLTVTPDKATAVAGEEVTFTVTMTSVSPLTSIEFVTAFPEGLTYVDASGAIDANAKATLGLDDIAWTEWSTRINKEQGDNFINGYASAPSGPANNTAICSFKVAIADDAATGEYAVGIVGAYGPELDAFMDDTWEIYDPSDIAVVSNAVTVVDHICDASKLTAVEAADATCTAEGNIAYYECECGKLYADADAATEITAEDVVIEKIAHTEETTTVDATCTVAGSVTVACSVCGEVISEDEIAALGHTEADAVVENEVAAGCETEGSYDSVVYCATCGEELSRETTTSEALGHTEADAVVENATEATCTEGGSYDTVVYCATCGEELSRVATTSEALGHTEADAVVENEVAAGCETEGSYDSVVYCAVCGEELSRETITVEATGHSYEAVVTAPTCVDAGYTTYTCSVCADSYEADEVAALGHTAGEAVEENAVEATCTADGSYDAVVYCTVCGEEISRETVVVPAAGHTAGEAVEENRVEATCTVAGSYDTVVYCTVCGAEISREAGVIAATGHSYEAVVTAPTCTEGGYTTYTCACGDEYVADEVDALGHTAGEWVEDEANKGTWYQYCTVCGVELGKDVRKVPVSGIKLDQNNVKTKYVRKAPAFTLTETVLPEDQLKFDYKVVWTSSNEKVATVDSDGNVTTHHRGEAVITATVVDAEGNAISSASCNVKVYYTFCQWLIWFFLLGCCWYFV